MIGDLGPVRSEQLREAGDGEKIPTLVLGAEELGWERLSRRPLERKLAARLGRI